MTFPFRRKVEPQYQGRNSAAAAAAASSGVQVSSAMYNAFLLHGGAGDYRVVLSAPGEGQAEIAPDVDNNEGGIGDENVGDEEQQQQQPLLLPVMQKQQQQQRQAAGDGEKSKQEKPGSSMPKLGFLKLTRRNIHILNVTAATVHAILFIVLYFQAANKGKQSWRLKWDKSQVVPKNVGDKTPFMRLFVSSSSNSSSASTPSSNCSLASPNVIDYAKSPLGTMQIWSYPKDAGVSIDLAWCVIVFFALSFSFQIGVSVYSWIGKTGYYNIFHNDREGKDTDEELQSYRQFIASTESNDTKNVSMWCSDMLAFNWARFVEYTFSGSLVLCTIALISGIVDYELLMCIFLLSASCMLMGLGAEYCMRASFALKMLSSPKSGLPEYARKLAETMMRQQRTAFVVLHATAWLCLALPWYIIFMHYRGWWEQCNTVDTKGESINPQPPDFVKAIIFMQGILFLVFGLVQLAQFFYPHKRRVTEVTYIGLSLTAKVLLGSILAANILLT